MRGIVNLAETHSCQAQEPQGGEPPPIILLNGHSIQLSPKSVSLYPKMSAALRPQERRVLVSEWW